MSMFRSNPLIRPPTKASPGGGSRSSRARLCSELPRPDKTLPGLSIGHWIITTSGPFVPAPPTGVWRVLVKSPEAGEPCAANLTIVDLDADDWQVRCARDGRSGPCQPAGGFVLGAQASAVR